MTSEAVELFDLMEHHLNDWLARAVEPPIVPPPEWTDPAAIKTFEERLLRLQGYLDRAEREAEQAFAMLESEIHTTRSWLEAFGNARNQLNECLATKAA